MKQILIVLLALNALAAVFFLGASIGLNRRDTLGRKLAACFSLLFTSNTLVLFYFL